MPLPAHLELITGPWSTLEVEARAIREQVFLIEQHIDPALEWDEHDDAAWHAVVRLRGVAVATARLLASDAGMARLGRMCVLPDHRRQGLGRALLDALVHAARQRGDQCVLLHAQCHAQRFYETAGFAAHGEVFIEAGIAHVEMTRRLP